MNNKQKLAFIGLMTVYPAMVFVISQKLAVKVLGSLA